MSAPAVVLAAAAARTKRIRLDERRHGAVVGRSGARLSAIRHPRFDLRRPRRDHGRTRLVHRGFSAVRLQPQRLRRAVRGKARPPASDSRSAKRYVARPASCAAQGPERLPARAATALAGVDRVRRHAAIGGARGALGLPLAIAIIGGEPARFGRWRSCTASQVAAEASRPTSFLSGSTAMAFSPTRPKPRFDAFFAPYAEVMSRVGRERGWPPLSRAQFDQGRGSHGHLMVGTPDEAIAKILAQHELFVTTGSSCRCRSATSRKTRSCARSSFLERSSLPECARSSQSGRFTLENGE